MFYFYFDTFNRSYVTNLPLAGIGASVGLFYLALYLLLSFGLYAMAKNNGIDKAYTAFLPFIRYVLMGKIVKESAFFGKRTNKMGVIAAAVTGASFALGVLTAISQYYLLFYALRDGYSVLYAVNGGFFVAETVDQILASPEMYSLEAWNVTNNVFYASGGINVLRIALQVLYWLVDLFGFFVLFSLYASLYARYKPGMSFIYTIVSTFTNLGGIFVFALRNREPITIRRAPRTDAAGDPYGRDPYGRDSYGRGETYGEGSSYEPGSSADDEPFSDFGKRDKGDTF